MIIPKNRLATFYLRYFAFTKIPLIFFVRPSVVYLDDKTTIIKIPFRRKVKNHWGSMYFGALSIGADLAAGFLAFQKIIEQNQQISLIFKNFTADFFQTEEFDPGSERTLAACFKHACLTRMLS